MCFIFILVIVYPHPGGSRARGGLRELVLGQAAAAPPKAAAAQGGARVPAAAIGGAQEAGQDVL